MYEKNESKETVFNYESDFLSPNQKAYTVQSTTVYASGKGYYNRRRSILPVIGTILATLAVIVLALYLFVFNTPKARLAKGLKALAADAVEYSDDLDKLLGTNALLEKINEDNRATVDMKLNATAQDQTIGFDYKMNYDGKEQLADLGFKASYSNISLLEGNMKADADKIYVAVPEVTDEWYFVNTKTLGADYNNSLWAEYLGLAVDEAYSFSLFENEVDNDADFQTLANSLMEEYAAKFAKNIKIEKSKDKIEIFRGGKSVTCKGINMIIGKDVVNNFMNDFINLYSASAGTGTTVQNINWVTGDIKICFYLDNKNNIVSITTAEAIKMYELGIAGVEFDFDFSGKTNVLDKIDGDISINIGGVEITAEIDRNASMLDGIYKENMTFAFLDKTGMGIRMKYTGKVDMNELQYDGEITMNSAEENIEILWEGSYQDVNKGESLTMQLDEVACSMNSEEVFKLAGDVTFATFEEKIEMPADAVDFMNMKEGDLMELMLGVEEYLTKFMQ